MLSLNQNRKLIRSYSFYNVLTRLLVCLVWMLAFVGGSIKANIPSTLQVKATSSAFASTVNKSDLPASSSDPIQMPEESAFLIAELDDQADDDKKITLPFFLSNSIALSYRLKYKLFSHFTTSRLFSKFYQYHFLCSIILGKVNLFNFLIGSF